MLQTPGAVPDLRGTWTGTWAGRPLTVLVVGQEAEVDTSVYLGSWPVLGRPLSGLSGTITYAVSGRPTSANFRGRLGRVGDGLTLVLEPLTQDGDWLELHLVGEGHVTGIGNSRWRPEARGTVELWRRTGPP